LKKKKEKKRHKKGVYMSTGVFFSFPSYQTTKETETFELPSPADKCNLSSLWESRPNLVGRS
jgi:hypothetical protein